MEVPASSAYLFQENFEGTGYENPWTESAGTPNEDYTTSPAPLEGSQSLYLDGSSSDQTVYAAVPSPGSGSTQEFYFLLNVVAKGSANTNRNLVLLSSSGTNLCTLFATSGLALRIRADGGTAVSTANTLSLGTTYHVWVTYKAGTGANAVATVAFSTDGIRPTSGNSYAISSNGTYTVVANRMNLWGDFTTASTNYIQVIFDKIRMADTTIGDNPA